MASTSSSPHPYQPYTIQYQVFLSFRGEDTRHTFTDHLYKSLIQAGIRTFRDTDDIERGQQLKPEIETAIIRSKASVVVLSNNYANSRWCLNELSLILEQRRKCGHFVLPVFYHVDPSNVRHRTGSFGIDGMKGTDDDVSRWTAALTEVANLSGMVLSGSETNFITEVVDTVQCKLDCKFLSTPAHLIGMESRVKAIESWLRNEQSNAIAICGMGGSGKTTLAQYIYNLNKQYFESSSFLEEIVNHNAEEYVSDCYHKEQYMKSYAYTIPPLRSEKYWPTVDSPLNPPPIKAQPGRPKKKRKRDPHENPKKPGKLTRHGSEMRCSNCNEVGHNKRGCKKAKKGTSEASGCKKSRGRPKKAGVGPSQASQLTQEQSQQATQQSRVGGSQKSRKKPMGRGKAK